MQDKFSFKIDDFVTWCKTAIKRYNEGDYADSLVNMRKSGEAACKLLCFNKYSEKVAIERTKDKSYKELIQLIISGNLADKKVVNWLETIQINGNDAAHDSTQASKENAEYTINSLKLLINWIFAERIETPVPSSLKAAIASINQPYQEQTTNQSLAEKVDKTDDTITLEKAEFEKLLASISEKKNDEERQELTGLTSELKESLSIIKDFRLEKEKLQEPLLKVEVPEIIVNTDNSDISGEIKSAPQKNSRKKIVYIGLGIVALILILFFAIRSNQKSEIATITQSASVPSSDSLHILILPFSVLQDNPNISLKFEDAIENTIKEHIKEKNLPISVFFDREFKKAAIGKDEAEAQARKRNVGAVLYGELYEPLSANDSSKINIKALRLENNNTKPLEAETRLLSFFRISDTMAINIRSGTVCFVDITYARILISKGKYNEAIVLLQDAKHSQLGQSAEIADLLVLCYATTGNPVAAIKEIEKSIALNPNNSNSYHSMANALFQLGDYVHSEEFYRQALSITPYNAYLLTDYANLLINPNVNRIAQAKEVVLKSLQYDTTISLSWTLLADYYVANKDFKTAEKYFNKSISIDSNTIAKNKLAYIFAFSLDRPKEGEKIWLEIVRKDSTNSMYLSNLVDLYTSTTLKDINKANYYFAQSKKYETAFNKPRNIENEGAAAIEKGEYKKAKELFLQLYQLDSSNIVAYRGISTCYFYLKDYEQAFYYAIRARQKDSLNSDVNRGLAILYIEAPAPYADVQKSIYYYKKALLTNPYDTASLRSLGNIYWGHNNIPDGKKVLLRFDELVPNDYLTNIRLANVYWNEGDFQKAFKCVETALAVNPNDDEANSSYGLILVQISPKNIRDGIKYAQKAIALNPDKIANYIRFAKIYLVAGDYNKANEYYKKAQSLNPEYKDVFIEQEIERLRLAH